MSEWGRAHRRASRRIRRRDWFANHVPVLGPLLWRYWRWRSR